MQSKLRVVIVGGGFAGLNAARGLADADVEVTLIDRRNFHLFQPLLYQVATGSLSPANIAAPLRSLLSKQENTRVLMAEVTGFDLEKRQVVLDDGDPIPFDKLIVATGSRHHYFSHDEWESQAPGLKTIEDATEIRRRILMAFEEAERTTDPNEALDWLTFVVVGGGPTGVELAGAIAEIARDTLRHEHRTIKPTEARVILVEALDRILGPYPEDLAARAVSDLQKLGAEVRTGTMVEGIDEHGLDIKAGDNERRIQARTVLWAAGVQGSPLGRKLAEAAGIETDRAGKLTVGYDLTLKNRPDIYVLGDLALFEQDGKPVPAVAQVAIQQGRYTAETIQKKLAGELVPPFRYKSRGSMATIGRSAAIADLGVIKLTGFIGWLAWLFVHVMQLVGFQNRMLVITQWAWNYFTRNRSARLITGRRTPQAD